jgi:hypothetical protein
MTMQIQDGPAKADSWRREPFTAGIALPYRTSFTSAQVEQLSADWCPTEPPLVAVVHLTYARTRPDCPTATLFESIEDWIERGMKDDHEEHSI